MFDRKMHEITFMVIGFFVTLPFALWKWVEIIIWLSNKIEIK